MALANPFGSVEDLVRRSAEERMRQQSRAAGRAVASASAQGATNPAAVARNVTEAQAEERRRIGGDMAQQMIAARQADQQQSRQLIGGLLTTGGQLVGMALPGVGPVAGVAGNLVSGGGSGGAPSLGAVQQLLAQARPQQAAAAPQSDASAPAVQRLMSAPAAPQAAPQAPAQEQPPVPGTPEYEEWLRRQSAISQLLPLLGRRVA